MIRLVLLPALALGLSGCGLLRAPVKVVGGVVQGTAHVTKAAATAPGKAWDKRKRRKEESELSGDSPRQGGEAADLGGSGARLDGEAPNFGGQGINFGGEGTPLGAESTPLGGEIPGMGGESPSFEGGQPAFDAQSYDPVLPE